MPLLRLKSYRNATICMDLPRIAQCWLDTWLPTFTSHDALSKLFQKQGTIYRSPYLVTLTLITMVLTNLVLSCIPFYYIPMHVLFKIHAVPSSEIQTSGSHFPYQHSLILRIRIMPVWRVNFNNMPKICRTTFCTKEDLYTSAHLICKKTTAYNMYFRYL